MKKNTSHTKILASFLTIFVLLTLCAPVFSQGQQSPQTPAPQPLKIADSSKPSAIIPWGVGGLLAVGVVAIGFKNAKRSHLD